MLKKIIAIKNVGRFRSSADTPNPQLGKFTLIHGANGFGKTTICSALRSLSSADPAYVIGRKTLGSSGTPTVDFLLEKGTASFDGATWKGEHARFAVFDGTFVAQNVYAGEVVDIEHKRNLYRVIIGDEGVSLAEQEAQLAGESRAKAGEITAIEKSLKHHVPSDMVLGDFIALKLDPDIDSKIEAQEREIEAIKQAAEIAAHPALSEFFLPDFPANFDALLGRTLDDVAADAEKQVADHLSSHKGLPSRWLGEGLNVLKGESCPFCGQNVKGLSLIASYRALFGEGYKQLKAAVTAAADQLKTGFGDAFVGKLTTLAAQNEAAAEYWRRYCEFDIDQLRLPQSASTDIQTLHQTATALLGAKSSSPLEPVAPDEAFTGARATYSGLRQAIGPINTATRAVNMLISAKKSSIGSASLKTAQSTLAKYRATKKRHEPEIDRACTELLTLITEKAGLEKDKELVREKLAEHTQRVVKPYEEQINKYLDIFNTGFRIAETKHSSPGGLAASSYQLVINDTAIDVGDAKTPHNEPSFKNTLSGGDRTTLALAFFLANLHRDPTRNEKVAVLDDPFTSQDAFRRRQTVHEIKKLAGECKQVIVLSHDVTFLKQVWEKAAASERVALQIYDARALGSKIREMDIDRACQGRVASEMDDLMTYLTTGAGKSLDLIKKMRVVLETYCRTTYMASFEANDWLGDIVRKIREGSDTHPAKTLYDELDQINDYTAQYHHGEDTGDGTPDDIDPDELTGFVRLTLKIVNAIQA